MAQDGGPAPSPATCDLFWKPWVSACGPPALLTSTLSVALVWSARIGLVSGHAQPRSENQGGGSMGQEPKLRLQDQADLVSA